MPEYKRTILSTRPVDEALVEKARSAAILLESISFIETEPVHTIEVQQEIELAAIELATVVFTSMNAVESVTHILDGHVPEWTIYCMGQKTKELVTAYFGAEAIAGTADNASALADEIIDNNEADEIIFFCGNQRRDELPHKLSAHDITVNEVPVYQTILIPHTLEKTYDAVLFFSPSAADSFFAKNNLPEHTVVFAIGSTTQQTVSRHSSNHVIVGKLPGKDALVEEAIAWAAGKF